LKSKSRSKITAPFPILAFLLPLVLFSCGGGGSGGSASDPQGNNPPTVLGGYTPASGTANVIPFHFTLIPSDPDGDSVELRIDFDGDGVWDTAYSSSTSYDHIFPVAGTYAAKVQARDSLGAESSVVNLPPLVVNDPTPTNNPPFISGTVNPTTGETGATLFSFSTAPSDPDGDSTAVRIDYEGDGTWDTGYVSQTRFDKVFVQSGTYTGKMQARDSNGAESGVSNFNSVTVNDPAPANHPPAVSTLPATGITTTGATLNGIVNPNGAATTAWFQYGTDPSFLSFAETAQQAIGPGTTGQAVSSTLTTLAPWQTYYFRIVARNGGGTQTGTIDSFPTGDYYVAVGDSITRGVSHDDIPSDGIGYEPVLKYRLDLEKEYPHIVVNEGMSGYTSADGAVQIATTLSGHPLARYYLVMYGTNDADILELVPSGLGLGPGDAGYSGSYKDNMQRIISAILAAGKTPYLAKVPYADNPQFNNTFLENYNDVVDELIFDNDILVIPPDFYAHFQRNPSGLSFDGFHPNGVGYQSMADLWFTALTAP
jgi:lysophospholipase L1-like esterase